MADISKTVAIIFQGENKSTQAINDIEKGLSGISASASSAAPKLGEMSQEVDKLGKGTDAVERLDQALRTIATAAVVKAFIDANVEVEKFERAMTLLKGSSEAAAAELEYIKNVSNTLGLAVFDAADAYVSLSASTKDTALEGAATRDIFEAVAKAMSSLGKSSADTQGALLAISQIVSKGTVSMEELRGQLGERLPGAFQIAANAMGVTTEELTDLVSSGKLAAEDFLPKFADALQKTFGETTYVDGYAASMARLQNSVSEAFIVIGKAGVFDAFTKGIQTATASVVGAVAFFEALGKTIGITAAAIASGDFSSWAEASSQVWADATEKVTGARDALLGIGEAAQDSGDSIDKAREYVAFYAQELVTLDSVQGKVTEKTDKQTDALARQAKEAARAEEAAQKMSLEMAKLASAKDISLIEAKVTLDVAQLEADTRKAEAIIDSLSTSITSTGNLLGDLFKSLDNTKLSGSDLSLVKSQIESENKARADAFKLQSEVAKEQIASLRARTRAMENGQAMIQIDGAGLQPHLEGFMWEILRTLQTRVNQDGLEMLVGAP